MKKIIFSLVFIAIVCGLNAQIQLYVRPTIYSKKNYSNNEFENINNPYIQFTKPYKYWSNGLGFNAGLAFKKNQSLELSYAYEQIDANTRFYYNVYQFDTTSGKYHISNGGVSSSIGFDLHRLSLDYHKQIFSSKNETIKLRVAVGLGVFLGKTALSNFGFDTIQLSSNSAINHYNNHILKHNFSPILKYAVGLDFYNKKKTHLFSFDVFYNLSFRAMLSHFHSIEVADNGNDYVFSYITKNRGSGLYLQISRRFQLYPWKPNKKEKY